MDWGRWRGLEGEEGGLEEATVPMIFGMKRKMFSSGCEAVDATAGRFALPLVVGACTVVRFVAIMDMIVAQWPSLW